MAHCRRRRSRARAATPWRPMPEAARMRSAALVTRLADSLPPTHPLRASFVGHSSVRAVVGSPGAPCLGRHAGPDRLRYRTIAPDSNREPSPSYSLAGIAHQFRSVDHGSHGRPRIRTVQDGSLMRVIRASVQSVVGGGLSQSPLTLEPSASLRRGSRRRHIDDRQLSTVA
jgi:hypothetical protein